MSLGDRAHQGERRGQHMEIGEESTGGREEEEGILEGERRGHAAEFMKT